MKILIHSNSPAAPSGYGVQVALLAERLAGDGHDVAVSCTWGHQVNVGVWTAPSGARIKLYPGLSPSGDEVIHEHALAHFGDPRAGWIIILTDVWSLQSPFLEHFNVIAWAPVDHDPVPHEVVKFFARSKALCLAMSQHGERQFQAAGLTPAYIPLAVDTNVYRPTWKVTLADGREVSSREVFHLPERAFVVGMVGMNKDPNDRKGFNEAFQAFARFHADHPHAVLFVHTEKHGIYNGLNLPRMAASYGIPESAIVFTEQYAYRMGLTASQMAAAYTAMDVLLAPSAGEGFCVPLIEAQACGTPVIASNFTAQPELVGAGWLLAGQRWWNPATSSHYFRAHVDSIVDALTEAHDSDFVNLSAAAREFAEGFDVNKVYAESWRPLLESLDPQPAADKPLMTDVAVLVPVMNRPENVAPLVKSFQANSPQDATLYLIADPDDEAERAAIAEWLEYTGRVVLLDATRGTSFANKINAGYEQTPESFIFVCGDDVEFTDGWVEEARKLSDRYDVIGTNDSEPGRVRNPKVAAGVHADHFFVRRSYIDDEGACLDGPGVAAPEAYFHWFTDMEMIQLAKARGVFAPCLDSRVIHHHPGYDGREDLRAADPTYSRAAGYAEKDQITFQRRAPLIQEQSIVRGSIW